MATSIPAASRSPFSHFARAKSKPEDKVDENDDNVVDDDDDEDEDENETDEDKEKKKQKKQKQKSEDKEDDDDDKEPEARAARSREKARVRAIMNCVAGQQFPVIALGLALDTTLPRHAAIKTLTRMTKNLDLASAGGDALRDRMAGMQQPDIGASDARPDPNLAERIIAAGRKRRGEI